MVVFPRGEMRDGIQKVAAYMKKNKLKHRFLTKAGLRRAAPGSLLNDVPFGFLDAEAGYVSDPTTAVTTIGRVAQRLGVEYHPFTTVVGFDVADGRVRAIITPSGRIEFSHVVNAAGSGAKQLARLIGVDLPISSERQQIVVVKPNKKIPSTYPTVIDYIKNIYVRPEINDTIIIGNGERGVPVNPNDFNEEAEDGAVESLTRLAAERFSFIRNAKVHRAYAGLYDVTPDDYPIIGELENVKGFINACGFSHGFKLGPAVGKAVSELILDGKYRTIDLSPLRFERFERHELIKPFLGKSGGGTG
jgi:sarcosine oxidase subunit beta